MEEIGPVDYAIVAFPGNQFKGEIAPALSELVESNTIRLIDVVFVTKTEDGDVVALELTELDPKVLGCDGQSVAEEVSHRMPPPRVP